MNFQESLFFSFNIMIAFYTSKNALIGNLLLILIIKRTF